MLIFFGRYCKFERVSILVKGKENVMSNFDSWKGGLLKDIRYYYIVIFLVEGLGKIVYVSWNWNLFFLLYCVIEVLI